MRLDSCHSKSVAPWKSPKRIAGTRNHETDWTGFATLCIRTAIPRSRCFACFPTGTGWCGSVRFALQTPRLPLSTELTTSGKFSPMKDIPYCVGGKTIREKLISIKFAHESRNNHEPSWSNTTRKWESILPGVNKRELSQKIVAQKHFSNSINYQRWATMCRWVPHKTWASASSKTRCRRSWLLIGSGFLFLKYFIYKFLISWNRF